MHPTCSDAAAHLFRGLRVLVLFLSQLSLFNGPLEIFNIISIRSASCMLVLALFFVHKWVGSYVGFVFLPKLIILISIMYDESLTNCLSEDVTIFKNLDAHERALC